MDSAHLPTAASEPEAPILSDPSDALAAFAHDWPDLASPLVGGQDVGDGSTYRAMLHLYLDQFLRGQSTAGDLDAIVAGMRAILDHECADQFKLALAKDARTATTERFSQNRVHSFWGVTPLINLAAMSACDRRLGFMADSFCYQPYYVSNAFDVVLKKQYEWALQNDVIAYSWLAFTWAMLRYDIFHTFYDRGLLLPVGGYGSPNYGVSEEEMQLLQLAGKRLYCLAYGADNRTRNRTLESDPINFCMHCPAPGRFCICDDEQAEKMFAVIDQYTTANLASGLSIDYVPNSYEFHYLCLDTNLFEPTPLEADLDRPLRILHAPNHPHFKGSHYLMDAVRELRAEGVSIELKLINGVPQSQVQEEMRAADIVADQFIGGFYGQTTIEAMALGRPVMCYIRDVDKAAGPDELPIINCNPGTLKETLRQLAEDRSHLQDIGTRSRDYVEKYHSLPALSERLRILYEETANLPRSMHPKDSRAESDSGFKLERNNPTDSDVMHAARAKMRDDFAEIALSFDRIRQATRERLQDERALLRDTKDEMEAAREHARVVEVQAQESVRLAQEAEAVAREAEAAATLEKDAALAEKEAALAAEATALAEKDAALASAARATAAELVARKAQREALEGERSARADEAAALQRIAALEANALEIAEALDASRAETADVAARAGRVASELRQMQASKAWRLTSPLRTLHDSMRRRPRATKKVAQSSPEVSEARRYLKNFKAAHDRPLRILHIGNIANNAYNNAKIQREWGIEADVLALDDYHIMASPEWEDADFRGKISNDYFPDWGAVNLKGFKRPDWFVQGPLDPAIRYLFARANRSHASKGLWRWLKFERWLLTRRTVLRRAVLWLIRSRTNRNVGEKGVPASAILLQYLGELQQKWSKPLMRAVPPLGRVLAKSGRRATRIGNMAERSTPSDPNLGDEENIDPYLRCLSRWKHPYFRALLSKYDVIQCYGTYTAIPLMAEHPRYFAYEHGTIRSIPFQPTAEGELCAASYLAAAAVFVTNSDNIAAAEKLGLETERTIALPHAVDSSKLIRIARANKPHAPGRLVRFFAPARHHWVDNDPAWAKGNDRVIHALARVRATGRQCVLHTVDWGKDTEASKALANSLGVADMIEWRAPMRKRDLWKEYIDCDAVLDQFVVPAFGGVTFEAMLLGRRVLTNIHAEQTEAFFGAAPPVYACQSIDEIARQMIRVIDDPSDLSADGARNQEWAQVFHGSERIVARQVAAYSRFGDLPATPDDDFPPRRSTTRMLLGLPYRMLRGGARKTLTAFRVLIGGPKAWRQAAGQVARKSRRAAYETALSAFSWGGKKAVRAAIPVGRHLTRQRMRRGRPRSVWGVTPILTLPLLARCDRMLGLRSWSLVYVTYYITKNFDIDLSQKLKRFAADGRAHIAFTYWVMARALLKFDTFNFFYDRGLLLPPNGRIWLAPEELGILKSAGKRIYTYAYGADVRTRETTLGLGAFNFCVDCPTPGKFCLCNESEAKRNVDGIRQHANAMVAMADMIHYVPGCRNFHYWPLDIDKIEYVGCDWRGQRPLQVLHAPNHMHFKGSRHLEAAIKRLQAEGVKIELRTISGVSNAEVLQAMAESDIIAEQFIGGAFGYTATEAWAMGKPVITYVRDPSGAPDWDRFPGINAEPTQLYDTLKRIAENDYDLPAIGLASRRYAEAHYSLEAVALELGKMYEETGELSGRTLTKVRKNIVKIRASVAERTRRPLPSAKETHSRLQAQGK